MMAHSLPIYLRAANFSGSRNPSLKELANIRRCVWKISIKTRLSPFFNDNAVAAILGLRLEI
jgi:uncharacterized membrane protein YdjX (TVP38/TMEM64 family)